MSAVSVASAAHFTPTACAAVSAFESSSRVMYESFSQRRTKRPRAKKVSWAPDERLCQVRTFASDDAPSQFSMSMFRSQQGQVQHQMLHYQQQLQMERSNSMPSLPPGFGPRPFSRPNDSMAAVAAMTAQVAWRSPDLVDVPPSWRVVAGNESNEVAVQKERENRVLEAVYPRPSAIPESPAEPVTAEEDYDDSMTPSISVVAQEDEEMVEVQEDGEQNEMREEEPTSAAREGNPNMSPWVAASQGQGMTPKNSRGGGGSLSWAHGNATAESSPPASMEVEGPPLKDESLPGVVAMSPEWEVSSVNRTMPCPVASVVKLNSVAAVVKPNSVGSVVNGTIALQSPLVAAPVPAPVAAPVAAPASGGSNGVVGVSVAGCEMARGDGSVWKQEEQQEAVDMQMASYGASEKATAAPPTSAADISMVAAAVVAALGGLGGSGVENIIDRDLLLQLLKNPSLMNTLLPPGAGGRKSDTGSILSCGNGSSGGAELCPERGTNFSCEFPTLSQGLAAAAADGKQGSGGSESKVDDGIANQGPPLETPVNDGMIGPAAAGGGCPSREVGSNAPQAKLGCPGEGGAAAAAAAAAAAPRNGILATSCQRPPATVQDDLPLLPPGFENAAAVQLQNGGKDIGGGIQSLHIGRMIPGQSNSSSWTGHSAGDESLSPDRYSGHAVGTSVGMSVSDLHGPPAAGSGCRFPLPFADASHSSPHTANGMLPEEDSSGRVGPSGVGVAVQRGAGLENDRYHGGGGGSRGMTGRGRGHFGAGRYARDWTGDHSDACGSQESSGFELGVQRDGQAGPEMGYTSAGSGDLEPGYHAGGGRLGRLSKVPCAFFGSSTGCRKGLKCPFLHDPAVCTGRGGFMPRQRDNNDDKAKYQSVAPNSNLYVSGPAGSAPLEGDRRPRSSTSSSASLWSCNPHTTAS